MPRYYKDETRNRQVLNYLRSLKRRAAAPAATVRMRCLNGPFAGEELRLSWPGRGLTTTAVIRVGNQVGRYVEKEDWLHWVPKLEVVS